MELYIVRHGQSTNNAIGEDFVNRVYDPELTVIGKQQAHATADYLKNGKNLESLVTVAPDSPERAELKPFSFTHLYCSAMHRALQTTYPISAAVGLKPEIWLDIHEHGGIYLDHEEGAIGHGGRTRTQILTEFPEYLMPESITDEGWWTQGKEDYPLAAARAMRVAWTLRERAAADATSGDRIIFVSHGTFIDVLIKALLNNLPNDRYFHWHYNCAITRLDILKEGRIIIRYINRVQHLEPELITT